MISALLSKIVAEPGCATQQGMFTSSLNWSVHVAHRAHIADRTFAVSAIAAVRAPDGLNALNILILAVSLVLLPGAVWMHAT